MGYQSNKMTDATEEKKQDKSLLFGALAGALLANKDGEGEASSSMAGTTDMMTTKTSLEGPNPCEGKKIQLDDIACMIEALDDGADVTEGVNPLVSVQAGGNVT